MARVLFIVVTALMASGVGLRPGFHCGFQVVFASQRMGATMEAMALVMWVKSMVRSSSLGW